MRTTEVEPCPVCGCPVGRWLRVSQVAHQFRCSEKRIRRLIKRGDLDAVRFGREWRIDHVSLDELVREESARFASARTADGGPAPPGEGRVEEA